MRVAVCLTGFIRHAALDRSITDIFPGRAHHFDAFVEAPEFHSETDPNSLVNASELCSHLLAHSFSRCVSINLVRYSPKPYYHATDHRCVAEVGCARPRLDCVLYPLRLASLFSAYSRCATSTFNTLWRLARDPAT